MGILTAALYGAVAMAQVGYLYPGFAEVHQPLNLPQDNWTWFPDQALAGSLVDGTVRLLGVEEQRRVWRGGAVTFFYQGSGAAELAYLTRNLGYGLYYDLDVDGGKLVGWAKVSNRLGKTLRFSRVTFVAGEVPLRAGSAPVMRKEAARAYDEMALAAPAPEPVYAGSGGGVFRYVLASPPPFEPGVNEVPFVRKQVEPVYTWSYRGGFVRDGRVNFSRGYTFTAPAALAAGLVNLRDGGVLLGQANMSDSASGDKVQLWLGRDPEGWAERRIQVLKDARKEKAYRVTTVLRNRRDRPVRIELAESFSADEVELSLPAKARRTPRGYRLELTLAPGAEYDFIYTVTLRY